MAIYFAKHRNINLGFPEGVEFGLRQIHITHLTVNLAGSDTTIIVEDLSTYFNIIELIIESLTISNLSIKTSNSQTSSSKNALSTYQIEALLKQFISIPIKRIEIDSLEYDGHQAQFSFVHDDTAHQKANTNIIVKNKDFTLDTNIIWPDELPTISTHLSYNNSPIGTIKTILTERGDHYDIESAIEMAIADLLQWKPIADQLPPGLIHLDGLLQANTAMTLPKQVDGTYTPSVEITIHPNTELDGLINIQKNTVFNSQFTLRFPAPLRLSLDSQHTVSLEPSKAQIYLEHQSFPGTTIIDMATQACEPETSCQALISMTSIIDTLEDAAVQLDKLELTAGLHLLYDKQGFKLASTESLSLAILNLWSDLGVFKKIRTGIPNFSIQYDINTQKLVIEKSRLTATADSITINEAIDLKEAELTLAFPPLACTIPTCSIASNFSFNTNNIEAKLLHLEDLTTTGSVVVTPNSREPSATLSSLTAKVSKLSTEQAVINDIRFFIEQLTYNESPKTTPIHNTFKASNLSLDADSITMKDTALSGKLSTNKLTLAYQDKLSLNTDLTLSVAPHPSNDGWLPELSSVANLMIDGNDIKLVGHWESQNKKWLLLDVSHNIERNQGGAELTTGEHDFSEKALSTYFSPWNFESDIVDGQGQIDATLRWKKADNQWVLNGTSQLNAENLTGFVDDIAFIDGNTNIESMITDGKIETKKPFVMTLQTLDIGLPISSIQAEADFEAAFSSQHYRIKLHSGQANLLGGQYILNPYQYPEIDKQPLNIDVKSIQLEEVLALTDFSAVSGNGSISGRLPLNISSEGVTMENGALFTDGPGVLQYRIDKATEAAALNNPSLKIALQALSNYQFDKLSAKARYEKTGDLSLGMNMNGKNPDFQNGQPINLNLNLIHPIPSLLKSLRASRLITDILKERFSQ